MPTTTYKKDDRVIVKAGRSPDSRSYNGNTLHFYSKVTSHETKRDFIILSLPRGGYCLVWPDEIFPEIEEDLFPEWEF